MSTEKKTDPSNERSQPSPPEVNKKKQGDELSPQDLDRVTGGGSGAGDRPTES
jgi:hypothetical protein